MSSDKWVEKEIKPLQGRCVHGWMLDTSFFLDAVDEEVRLRWPGGLGGKSCCMWCS